MDTCAKCKICQTFVKSDGNTTNLKYHLKRKHAICQNDESNQVNVLYNINIVVLDFNDFVIYFLFYQNNLNTEADINEPDELDQQCNTELSCQFPIPSTSNTCNPKQVVTPTSNESEYESKCETLKKND